MKDNGQIGRVVYSKAGRDKGRFFMVIGVLNEEYVYISNEVADEVRIELLAGNEVSNLIIRKFLQSHDMNKEV